MSLPTCKLQVLLPRACLVINRGAHLSSGGPPTIFPQHCWSVLSEMSTCMSKPLYLISRCCPNFIPFMEMSDIRLTPMWAGSWKDFNLAAHCHGERDAALCSSVAPVVLYSAAQSRTYIFLISPPAAHPSTALLFSLTHLKIITNSLVFCVFIKRLMFAGQLFVRIHEQNWAVWVV